MSLRSGIRWFLLASPLLGLIALFVWVLRLPSGEAQIAAYATGLRGRTRSQVHNVELALQALDGQVIAPGREFSFAKAVGPWTEDRGYRKAPVSYSGDMTVDWGGGVCQASSTLYNAALLAGLPITERHRHYWPASYVPPGQDAAVAYPNIDLRFRNPLRHPIRISARVEGESLLIRLFSRDRPPQVSLDRRVLSVRRPTTVVRYVAHRAEPRVTAGQPGYDVVLYRVFSGQEGQRELVSRDSYPAQNRVVWR
jgi:vancomycin resistance protein YoaR